MDLTVVPIVKPDAANFIFGQSHFIKTVEDLHEARGSWGCELPSRVIAISRIEIVEVCLRVGELPDVLTLFVGWVRARCDACSTVRIIIYELHEAAILVGNGIGAA